MPSDTPATTSVRVPPRAAASGTPAAPDHSVHAAMSTPALANSLPRTRRHSAATCAGWSQVAPSTAGSR